MSDVLHPGYGGRMGRPGLSSFLCGIAMISVVLCRCVARCRPIQSVVASVGV